jgi:hypothetical protein
MKAFRLGSFAIAPRLECDDDKARFEVKLGKLAKAKGRGSKGE